MAVTDAGDEARAELEWIERIGNGDRAAFTLLYDRYFPRVRSFVARRIGNRADVEETVQEVFVNIFSSLGSYRGEAPFAAWVFGVTRRTVAGRFKKKRHQTVALEEARSQLDLPARSGPTPLDDLECSERLQRLERTLERKLSAVQQRLFDLHHLRHRSIREIAALTNRSEESVKSGLYRARRILLAS